jgi:hypothetical protein
MRARSRPRGAVDLLMCRSGKSSTAALQASDQRQQTSDRLVARWHPRQQVRQLVTLTPHFQSGAGVAAVLRKRHPTGAPCRHISAIAISSTQCATSSCRRSASRTCGATDDHRAMGLVDFSHQAPQSRASKPHQHLHAAASRMSAIVPRAAVERPLR